MAEAGTDTAVDWGKGIEKEAVVGIAADSSSGPNGSSEMVAVLVGMFGLRMNVRDCMGKDMGTVAVPVAVVVLMGIDLNSVAVVVVGIVDLVER